MSGQLRVIDGLVSHHLSRQYLELRPWPDAVSFRANSGRMQESALWASFHLEASSQWALFLQAERMPEAALGRLPAERPA